VPLHRIELPPRSGAPSQTLVLLHGYGADEHDLLSLGHHLDPGFRVVSLAAPLTLPWGGRAWYQLTQSGSGFGWDPAEVVRATTLAAEEIEAIGREAGVPPLLLGFSQGAGIALTVALLKPGAVRGVLALSAVPPDRGGATPGAGATKGLPVFLGHGTRDPLLPIAAAHHSRALLEEAGCDVTFREYAMAHEISEAELADVKAFLAALPAWPRTR
jgi:phospholipase/carboxylesterase